MFVSLTLAHSLRMQEINRYVEEKKDEGEEEEAAAAVAYVYQNTHLQNERDEEEMISSL